MKRLIAALVLMICSPACLSNCPKSNSAQKPVKYSHLPAINLDELAPEQREAFLSMANEEICPCDCPKTFAGCLQQGSQCKPAVLLAQWAIDRIKEGLPTEQVVDVVSKEIGLGFASKPVQIETDDFYRKGATNSQVTIVEFADFECGHCRTASQALRDLSDKNPGEIQVIFKHFPLPLPSHQMAKRAALVAEAAGKQGKFWQMHDAIFGTQNALSDNLLNGHAKAIGLDFVQFQKDKTDPKTEAKITRSQKEAERLGIKGTPAIFFNGRPCQLPFDVAGLETRLAMEEARTTATCN